MNVTGDEIERSPDCIFKGADCKGWNKMNTQSQGRCFCFQDGRYVNIFIKIKRRERATDGKCRDTYHKVMEEPYDRRK